MCDMRNRDDMRTPITEALGIELPIFAFSHCRDVVAWANLTMTVVTAASKAPEILQPDYRPGCPVAPRRMRSPG